MNLNDNVNWTVRGLTRSGRVVKVIPAGVYPHVTSDLEQYNHRNISYYVGTPYEANPRDHESYLVACKTGKTDKAKLQLFWPRVKDLKKEKP